MKNLIIRLIPFIVLLLFLLLLQIIPKSLLYNNSIYIYILFIILLLLSFIVSLILFCSSKRYSFKDNISLESIPKDFEEIYKDLYDNHISSLESLRKKVRLRTIIQYTGFAFFIIGYIFAKVDVPLPLKNIANNLSLLGLIGFALFISLIFLNYKHVKKYKDTYKKEIVSNFIKLINEQLEYKPFDLELLRSKDDYKKANFDNKPFNRFYSDDYIEGFIDNETFIKMYDLHIQHHTGSGKNSHTEEIFQGIFAQTKSGKDIGTYIKISKNKIKLFNKHDRIEMDSKEFEKYFDIYSENRILTMRLLTSDIMESLIDFYNKYNLDYEIVFRNNTIYMRFFTGAMFEPKIFGNSMDKELLFIYFCILKFVVDIGKKINNTLLEIEI